MLQMLLQNRERQYWPYEDQEGIINDKLHFVEKINSEKENGFLV